MCPSEDGLSVYFSEITDKVNAQEDLKKLSVVADKSHSGVIIADKEGTVEWVNESFTHITGYSFEEATGKDVVAFFEKFENSKYNRQEIFLQLTKTGYHEIEIPFKGKEGQEVWLRAGLTPVSDDHGKPFRYIIMLTDVSLQKQAVLERNQIIEELESRSHSLQQFTHLVSHKLRAPVANIPGLVNVFGLPSVDEQTKEQVVRKLRIAASDLDFIIRDLNHILSIREAMRQKKRKLILSEALSEVIEILKDDPEGAQIDLRYDFTEASCVSTVIDSIVYILRNLLANAINFRSSAGKAIVKVYTKQEGDYAVLYVRDNGLGFDLKKTPEKCFWIV